MAINIKTTLRTGLTNILDGKKINDIFYSALKILNEIGIECRHKKTIDLLQQNGKITYKNERIHFDPDAMEEFFHSKVKSFTDTAIDENMDFKMGSHWHAWELCDPITNMPRPATLDEAAQMARLSEMLGGNGCPIPVAPGGINPRLNTLTSEKIALLNTKKLGGALTATDSEEIKILSQMHQAAGRKYTLGLEGLISPLKVNSKVMDVYFEHCNSTELDISIMGIIPMAGATAPLVFPANLSLMLADALGLDYIMQTISNGKHGSFSFRLDPFDFKSGNIVFGSPAWCVYRQAISELWEGLMGKPMIGGVFRSNSKTVGSQAMMERTASAIWQALLGVRAFSAVGQLSVDEVYSPVQAILDRELLKYLRNIFYGNKSGWAEDIDIIALVKEGIEDGGFIGHDTTIGYFRRMYDFDILSSYTNLNAWKSQGCKTIEALAWEEAKLLINQHDFVLDDKKRKDVEQIFNAGVKYLIK